MKRMLCALAGGLALWAAVSRLAAAPRVEADPNRDYAITAEAGPWMIMAASYTGPTAVRLAHELVYQIRRRDNLPAYFFDYSAEERKRLANYVGSGRRGTVRIQDQCAVLIGGYPDMDAAKRALNDVKKLKPPEDERLMDRFVVQGPSQSNPSMAERKGTFLNPFLTSFVTRNPMVPHDKPPDPAKDPILKVLNADEEYSLLKCPRPWTLAVQEYAGLSVVGSAVTTTTGSFWEKIGLGDKSKDVLSASGMQAHELAKLLRSLKPPFEAYVLHTRTSSVVTIGGFDGRDDGHMKEAVEKLEHLKQAQLRQFGQDPLHLYSPPIPMEVPRP